MSMAASRRHILAGAGAATVAGLLPLRLGAESLTPANMILNWRYQGPQGWFFLAEDRGYFRDAGVELAMDQGSGSGAAVTQVAGGAYDMGSATSTPWSSWRPNGRRRRRSACSCSTTVRPSSSR